MYVKEVKGSPGASTFNKKGDEGEDVNNNNHDGRGMVASEIYIHMESSARRQLYGKC